MAVEGMMTICAMTADTPRYLIMVARGETDLSSYLAQHYGKLNGV